MSAPKKRRAKVRTFPGHSFHARRDHTGTRIVSLKKPMPSDMPVLVIPFDAASREALVAQVSAEVGAVDARKALACLHPDFAKEGSK